MSRPAFVVVFLLWWVIAATWALATPIWGSPDEYQHAYRAYAAVRGAVVIRPEAAEAGTGGFVDGPRGWDESIKAFHCFASRPTKTANCLPPLTNDASPQRVPTTAARYDPVYYLAVGTASLVTGPAHSVWAMRILSGGLSALFLAWALTSAVTSRRPVLAGSAVILASTPMVSFLAASINPNGLEITAAMSAWVNGFLLLRSQDEMLRRRFTRRTAVSAMAVLVMRGLSPLWVVVLCIVLVVAAGQRQLLRRIWLDARGWWLAVAATAIAAAAWTVLDKTLVLNVNTHPYTYTFAQRLNLAWGNEHKHVFLWRGTVGIFGWLDTNMPLSTVQFWTVVGGAVAVLALVAASWRGRIAFVLLAAAVLVIPTVLEAQNWNVSRGGVWQPRYTMPISLAVVLLAGLLLAESGRWPRWRSLQLGAGLLLCVTAIWTNLCGFVYALSRYIVGAGQALSLRGAWQPPLPATLLVIVQAIAWLLLSAWVLVRVSRSTADDSELPAGSTENPAAVEHEVGARVHGSHHDLRREGKAAKVRQPDDDDER